MDPVESLANLVDLVCRGSCLKEAAMNLFEWPQTILMDFLLDCRLGFASIGRAITFVSSELDLTRI